MLPKSANTVIIGGGVLGASAAFHLSDSGQTDVVLLDRGPIASILSADRFGDSYPTDTSLRTQCEEIYAHHYHKIY